MKLRAKKSIRTVLPRRSRNAYWNGERCYARRVVVLVGYVETPTWWCAGMVGQERAAVEVTYKDHTFFLDDEDGAGWAKVTEGMGSPQYGHASLPRSSVVLRERVPAC